MNHTRDLSRVRRVLRRRREDAKRGRNERERCRTNLINGDIDTTMLFLSSSCKYHGIHLHVPPQQEALLLCLLSYYFISPSIAIFFWRVTSFSRELVFFQVETLSLSLSLVLHVHTRAFLGGKGARPGAAVSKYDTGIGYKETINHTQARVNGTRPLRETPSGRFLRGYLSEQAERKKKREREEEEGRECKYREILSSLTKLHC